MLTLQSNIKEIKGIGDVLAGKYAKLNIVTVEELISHYPRQYDMYGEICNISDITEGETVTVEVALCARPSIANIRNMKIINAVFKDKSGRINVTWYNMPFVLKSVKMGAYYILRGRVKRKRNGLTIEQPAIVDKQEYYNKRNSLQPVYSLTAGISNNNMCKNIAIAVDCIRAEDDILPAAIRKKYQLVTYKKAIKEIHFPENDEMLKEARKRLVFEEFFRFILAIRSIKTDNVLNKNGRDYSKYDLTEKLIESLPYELTPAQKKTVGEIKGDMMSGTCMNRMVQGDVGSGKTVIALISLMHNYENGYQGALMVPTEVLARQHYAECVKLLMPFGVKVCLLTGSMTAKEKKLAYADIKEGRADIIIGTHALIQNGVEYHKLGLVITDEQHRFGVNQRKKLMEGGTDCHTLVMSATPIPRSLALILYGDMDMSIIDTMPAGRIPIKNCVVDTSYRQTAYRFIEKQVANGEQVYIICPMVEHNEDIEAESVIEYGQMLKENLSESIRIEILYGSMNNKEKNIIMEKFADHEVDVLVSTTVIEVGINVPNATVMMIENADRFGLATLHQLRGRVGRGSKQSYCIFMSGNKSKKAMERLGVLNKSNDGFFIASEDLKLRGPGEMDGIRQSGELAFELADIYKDADILKMVDEAVKNMDCHETGEVKPVTL